MGAQTAYSNMYQTVSYQLLLGWKVGATCMTTSMDSLSLSQMKTINAFA